MTRSVTLYHADWCGYCKMFMPEWSKLQEKSQLQNISTHEFELTKDKSIMEKEGITGFPTIVINNNGNKYKYSGERTADAILNELNRQSGGGTENLQNRYRVLLHKYKKYKAKYTSLKQFVEENL